jgi:hypothetical protein
LSDCTPEAANESSEPLEQVRERGRVRFVRHPADHLAELEQERGDIEASRALAGKLGAEERGVALDLAGRVGARPELGRGGHPERLHEVSHLRRVRCRLGGAS